MLMKEAVYEEICGTLSPLPPEHGGILGAGADGSISEFYFDRTGESTADSYTPDVEAINRVLVQDWLPRGVRMVGIVHSHRAGIPAPSCGDVAYGGRILAALEGVKRFYLPIAVLSPEGLRLEGYVLQYGSKGEIICRREEIEPGK